MKRLFDNLKIKYKVGIIIVITTFFLTIITGISYLNSSKDMEQAVENEMALSLDATLKLVNSKLALHSELLLTAKAAFEAKGDLMTRKEVKAYIERILPINKETFGMGFWYELDVLDEYFGPYAYKEGNEIIYTQVYEDPKYHYPGIDWYKLGIGANEVLYTSLYYDDELKKTFISAAIQIIQDDKVVGVISGDYVLDSIQEIVSDVKIGESGYAFLVDNEGNFLTHPDPNVVNNLTMQEYLSIPIDQISDEEGNFNVKIDGTPYLVDYKKVEGMPWKVVLLASEKEMYAPLKKSVTQQIISSAILLVIMVGIIFAINRYITRGVTELKEHLNVLSTGDLTKKMSVHSTDEFGEMAKSYNETLDSLGIIINNIHVSSETVAATSEELTASVNEVHTSITSIATSMTEMTETSSSQYEKNEHLNSLTTNITANMEKFSETLQTVVDSSILTVQSATKGATQIQEFISEIMSLHKQVESSAELVEKLRDESQKIEMMSKLISKISDQTNLLSLNAAIEAARAGESGKGFAVVADEVRKLAEQTGNTSKEIAVMVQNIQGEIETAVTMMGESRKIAEVGIDSVQETGAIFLEIEGSVNNLKDMIDETNVATTRVFSELQSISSIVSELRGYASASNDHTLSVSAITEEQSAVMGEMADASTQLANLAQGLQTDINKFQTLSEMRK